MKTEHVCIPWFWAACAAVMAQSDPACAFGEHLLEGNVQLSNRILKFAKEAHRLDHTLTPVWATPNRVTLDLPTMQLRDFSQGSKHGLPVIVDAPYAGHSSTIADYSAEQSLVRALKANGLSRVHVTDWKSATEAMKDFSIDTYLEDLNSAVDYLGGKVHLIGLCQGGWLSAAFAARFPGKVATLVLAGSPMDTSAGKGMVKDLANTLPIEFYRELVAIGGGRLLGKFMLSGWKSMNPTDQYLKKYFDLFENIEDEQYLKRAEEFSRWYETTLDLPGVYYLQAVEWLFKENRLAKGKFVALGKTIALKDIDIPVYMLGGEADDITPPEQVFHAEEFLSTPKRDMAKKLVPGGHIGLFMGRKTLETAWPEISAWILAHSENKKGKHYGT